MGVYILNGQRLPQPNFSPMLHYHDFVPEVQFTRPVNALINLHLSTILCFFCFYSRLKP